MSAACVCRCRYTRLQMHAQAGRSVGSGVCQCSRLLLAPLLHVSVTRCTSGRRGCARGRQRRPRNRSKGATTIIPARCSAHVTRPPERQRNAQARHRVCRQPVPLSCTRVLFGAIGRTVGNKLRCAQQQPLQRVRFMYVTFTRFCLVCPPSTTEMRFRRRALRGYQHPV